MDRIRIGGFLEIVNREKFSQLKYPYYYQISQPPIQNRSIINFGAFFQIINHQIINHRLKRLLKGMVHNPNVRSPLLNLAAGKNAASEDNVQDIPDLHNTRASLQVSWEQGL